VRICPTDKNLGPAVVDADFYNTQTMLHLNDEKTYEKIPLSGAIAHAKTAVRETKKLLASSDARDYIAPSVQRYIKSFFPDTFDEHSLQKQWNGFYLLVKIHKNPTSHKIHFESNPGFPVHHNHNQRNHHHDRL